jgi:hypothetical protein
MTTGRSEQDLAGAAVLARWLGVTDKTVRELANAGIAVRAKRGLYRLEESVRRYLRIQLRFSF